MARLKGTKLYIHIRYDLNTISTVATKNKPTNGGKIGELYLHNIARPPPPSTFKTFSSPHNKTPPQWATPPPWPLPDSSSHQFACWLCRFTRPGYSIHRVTACAALCVCLPSLSVTLLRLTHAAVYISSSLLFVNNYTHRPKFVYALVHWWTCGLFWLLPIGLF